MLPSVKRKEECLSGKATPRYLSWEGQGPQRPHSGGSSMEECVAINPPRGNARNLDVSLVWMLGREGKQARPGNRCGQCCGWSQGPEPVLHKAPTSLGYTSYPLPSPVVNLGPDWGKFWNSKPPLSRPFPGVPSVCSLKHELNLYLRGHLFISSHMHCHKASSRPREWDREGQRARPCMVSSPAPIWPHLPLFIGPRSQMAPGPDLSHEHSHSPRSGVTP